MVLLLMGVTLGSSEDYRASERGSQVHNSHSKKQHQRTGISVGADFDQPIFPAALSQCRSCADASSSTHQKSEVGSMGPVLFTDQRAASILSNTAQRGLSRAAPAARNPRRMPSGHPYRARLVNQRHRKRASPIRGISSNPAQAQTHRIFLGFGGAAARR